jgi:AAA15 family ATPase/GTPase
MKKLMLLLVVFMFLLTSSLLANDFTSYINAIKKIYEREQKSETTIQSWKDGVSKNYNYTLSFVTINFEFVDGALTTEDEVIIGGITTTTGYCYTKDENKIRIVQIVGMVFLMSNDGQVKSSFIISDFYRSVLPGWDGKDV